MSTSTQLISRISLYISPQILSGMALRACPVCGIEQDADDLAFEHHVNSHFAEDDAMSEGRVGSSSPRKRRLSTYKDREELEAGYSDVWGSEDKSAFYWPF